MEYNPEQDLRILEAMASNLTPYLYEKELYGTLSKNLPKLTVGGLLLRLYRLKHLEELLDSDQQQRLRDAVINFEQLRSEWMVHYESKVQQELQARLRGLDAFLDDYAEDATLAKGNYPVEALHRTIIYHLQEQAKHLDLWNEELMLWLEKTDRRLHIALGGAEGDEFIWDEQLRPIYPPEIFWWLYNTPAD